LYSVFTPFKNAVLDEFLSAKTYPEVSVDGLKDIQQIDYQNENSLYLGQNVIKKLSQLITSADIFSLIKKNNQLYLKPFIEPVNLDKIVEINEQDIVKNWYCNEEQCHAVWERFLESNLLQYKLNRDSLENDVLNNSGATSRMSVGLKWGLVSSRFLKESVLSKYGRSEIFNNQNLYHYISELIWREFYKYILYHHPNVLDQEFQTKFRESISWVENSVGLERFITWIKGETGYKIVDAAMQQIRQLGWMHNRSRMIVASILTKNLGVDWRWGQEYFRFMLLDLDEASNNGGWQWASSVGSDPKPIRIFNPYLQAENYDSKNLYQKKWLPSDYSIEKPIIDHKIAREQALLRYNLNNLKPRDY
jgi:deoxyribodipyrimidine photolyase